MLLGKATSQLKLNSEEIMTILNYSLPEYDVVPSIDYPCIQRKQTTVSFILCPSATESDSDQFEVVPEVSHRSAPKSHWV